MNVYIIMEHPDAFGGTADDLNDIVLGIFFDKERAEDFVRGIMSYVSSYEDRELLLVDGKAQDANDTVWFQVVEKGVV